MSRIHDALKEAEAEQHPADAGEKIAKIAEMETCTKASEKLPPSRRRTFRLSLVIPIIIRGADTDGNSLKENTWTISVSKHGAKLATFHHLAPGAEITLENPVYGHTAKARVVCVEKGRFQDDPFEVGVELLGSSAVWGIKFPPEDWKNESSTARGSESAGNKLLPALEFPSKPDTWDSAASAKPLDPARASLGERVNGSESPCVAEIPVSQSSSQTPSAPLETGSKDDAQKPVRELGDVDASPSRLEPSPQGVSALLDEIKQAHQELKAQVEGAEQRIREIARQVVESTLREFHARMEEEKESVTSSCVENSRGRITKAWSEAIEPFIASEKSQWESVSQDRLFRLNEEARQQVQQIFETVWKEFSEKARTDLEEVASATRAESQKALQGSLEGNVAKQFSAFSEQASRELASRELAFKTALQEMASHAHEDLKGLESNVKESMRSEAENLTAEAFRRSASSMEEGLRRIEEASQQKELALKEEIGRFKQRLASISTSSHDGFLHYMEILSASLKGEVEKSLRSVEESAVQAAGERIRHTSEELLESVASQMRQETDDALLLLKDELQRAGCKVVEHVDETLVGSTEARIKSVNDHVQAIISNMNKLAEDQATSIRERLEEAERQLAATSESIAAAMAQKCAAIETEYRRKIERVFAESMDTRLREFEDHLTRDARDHRAVLNPELQEEVESVRQRTVEQVRLESDRAAKNAVGIIHQGIGAAAMMLKDWTDQATQRLEGAVRESAKASQQQIGAYVAAALEELHRGASLQLKDLRDHLRQAASALESVDVRVDGAKPQEAAVVPFPTRASNSTSPDPPDEHSGGTQERWLQLWEESVDQAVKGLRSKLEEILKSAEQPSHH